MREEKITVAAADGAAETVIYTSGEKRPGVLFYTDIFGIRPANQSVARRLAQQGFAVLMPNVFYRFRPLPLVHEGEEGGIVLSGRLEVTVDDERRILGPGDAYYFESRRPHRFRCVGPVPCEVISACTPPTF